MDSDVKTQKRRMPNKTRFHGRNRRASLTQECSRFGVSKGPAAINQTAVIADAKTMPLAKDEFPHTIHAFEFASAAAALANILTESPDVT